MRRADGQGKAGKGKEVDEGKKMKESSMGSPGRAVEGKLGIREGE